MTTSRRRPQALTFVLVIVGSVLAGAAAMFGTLTFINGEVPVPVASTTPTPSVTPRPLPATAWAEATATALPVSVVAPGATLSLGEPAQVELALGGGRSALVSITPTAPTPASPSDLAILRKATPQLAGMSVYYLPLTLTKVAGDSLSGVELATVIFGVTASNVPLQQLTLVDWRACSGGPLPAVIDDPGTEVTLCFAAASAEGANPAAGVEFSQARGPYDAGMGTAVSWLP